MPPAENNKPVILFLPPWEDHEIALMHTWYLLKSVGQRVIYLGQRVPLKALLQAIDAVSPGALMTFFISEETGKAIRSFINGIKDRHPHLPLYAGIRSDLEARNFLTTVPGLTLLHDPQEVVSLVAGNINTP